MAFDRQRAWSLRTSFWLVVTAQVLLFAGSNFPTPLFPIYERRYGFGSGTVTLLFGVYVVVVVPTVVLLGPVADRIGRRPLLVAGIAVTVVSSFAFALAHSIAWLFAGEIIYGVGAGMVMACVAAAIRELHPQQHLGRAALAASVAAAAGLTLGPLVSGTLASITPWPTVSPYALDVVLAGVLAAALVRIPETRPPRAATTKRAPLVHVPADVRMIFIPTAAAGAASFMVIGWVFGLSPSYLHEELHVHISQPVVIGLFAALVMFTNGATQIVLRRHHNATAMRAALAGVVCGMGVMAASTVMNSLAVALVGAVVAGVGTGVAQMNAMATIQQISPNHARGAVTSAYYTVCYLGLSLPVIVAGEAADHFGVGLVTAGYLLGVIALVGMVLALARQTVGQPLTSPSAFPADPTPPNSARPPNTSTTWLLGPSLKVASVKHRGDSV